MGKETANQEKDNWTREELEAHRDQLDHQLMRLEKTRDNLITQAEHVRGAVSLLNTLLRQEEVPNAADQSG